MLSRPLTKNEPKIHDARSDSDRAPRAPTERMMATGPLPLGVVAAARTNGGTRLFHESDVELVRIAATLAETTSVVALQELATGRERFTTGRESSAYIGDLLAEVDAQINARIAVLKEAKSDLAMAMQLVASCMDCPNRPNSRDCPDCLMTTKRGASQIARIVWDS